jgi:hypothetical protein
MSIEAMKQALEALDAGPNAYLLMNTGGIANKLRQAIAEAERQEPAAIATGVYGGRFTYVTNTPNVVFPDGTAFYTHPQPKREWVGLTDDEIEDCYEQGGIGRAIQMLKEKNT